MDTVGFIQDLPTDLVHSFRATLEEVRRADLLLHVRDASVEPRVHEAQRAAVEETLGELGAGNVMTLEVWNKVDAEVVVELRGCHEDGGGGTGGDGGDDGGGGGSGGDGGGGSGSGSGSDGGSSGGDGRLRSLGWGAREREHEGDREDRRRECWGGEGPGAGHGKESDVSHDMSVVDCRELQTREKGEVGVGGGVVSVPRGNLSGDGAIRVSAATGEGLGLLLERIDAALHLSGDGQRSSLKPVDRYQYVRILPGQSQQ